MTGIVFSDLFQLTACSVSVRPANDMAMYFASGLKGRTLMVAPPWWGVRVCREEEGAGERAALCAAGKRG